MTATQGRELKPSNLHRVMNYIYYNKPSYGNQIDRKPNKLNRKFKQLNELVKCSVCHLRENELIYIFLL